jgi:hypothetical protein
MIFFAFAMVAATSKDRRASTSVLTYLAEDHKIIERFIAKSSSVYMYIYIYGVRSMPLGLCGLGKKSSGGWSRKEEFKEGRKCGMQSIGDFDSVQAGG